MLSLKDLPMFSSTADLDVEGKVAVITGAAQGIGLALAIELHRRGARVAILDITGAQEAVDSLSAETAFARTVDVRDREAIATAIAEVTTRFGRIDIVVANAGVTPPPATLRTIDPSDYDRVIAINQTGVFNTVRPALEQIIAHRGHVVVVSSVAAFTPGPGGAAYMISKAAVE